MALALEGRCGASPRLLAGGAVSSPRGRTRLMGILGRLLRWVGGAGGGVCDSVAERISRCAQATQASSLKQTTAMSWGITSRQATCRNPVGHLLHGTRGLSSLTQTIALQGPARGTWVSVRRPLRGAFGCAEKRRSQSITYPTWWGRMRREVRSWAAVELNLEDKCEHQASRREVPQKAVKRPAIPLHQQTCTPLARLTPGIPPPPTRARSRTRSYTWPRQVGRQSRSTPAVKKLCLALGRHDAHPRLCHAPRTPP